MHGVLRGSVSDAGGGAGGGAGGSSGSSAGGDGTSGGLSSTAPVGMSLEVSSSIGTITKHELSAASPMMNERALLPRFLRSWSWRIDWGS